MASVTPLGAPGLIATIGERQCIYNQTFGGIIINIEQSENAYGYKNTVALVEEYGNKGVQAAKDMGAIQQDYNPEGFLKPIKDVLAEKLPGFNTCTIPFDTLLNIQKDAAPAQRLGESVTWLLIQKVQANS